MVASRAGACPETTHMSSRDVQLLKTVQNAFKSQPYCVANVSFLKLCVYYICLHSFDIPEIFHNFGNLSYSLK